ncbi:hypothetical protein EDC94DRAFT_611772 [Helicostylum pulchrum]|nr:hypothetical protein EDC94DRAFT_611772 [Helicostylum pulchrum]
MLLSQFQLLILEIVHDTQIVQFLNQVYVSTEPWNESLYTKKKVSSRDIFSLIMLYTTRFDEKSLLSFIKWCSANDIFANILISQ